MTTRGDFRTRIRRELNDSGGTPLWPNAQLDDWILEGLRQMVLDGFGRERSATIATVVDQAAYALAADTVEVLRVEYPAGHFRKRVPFVGGDRTPESDLALGELGPRPLELLYDTFGGELLLSPAPTVGAETIRLRYRATYTEPSGDASVLDVAALDEGALLFYACERALQWLGGDESKRQRFERQRGSSPQFMQREYEQGYRRAVSQRRRRVPSGRLVIRADE